MENFIISYDDLKKAHEYHNKIYNKSYKEYDELNLNNKDPWEELDEIIDLVRKWNKHGSIKKHRIKIKITVLKLKDKFDSLNDCYLEKFDFSETQTNTIINIFDTLSENGLKYTASTKLMHCINSNLFVMWDKDIRNNYGCYQNSIGYIRFMKTVKNMITDILKQRDKNEIMKENDNKTLTKLIDEYNFMKIKPYRPKKNEVIMSRYI